MSLSTQIAFPSGMKDIATISPNTKFLVSDDSSSDPMYANASQVIDLQVSGIIGVADPTTNPGIPTTNVAYSVSNLSLTSTLTYPNFTVKDPTSGNLVQFVQPINSSGTIRYSTALGYWEYAPQAFDKSGLALQTQTTDISNDLQSVANITTIQNNLDCFTGLTPGSVNGQQGYTGDVLTGWSVGAGQTSTLDSSEALTITGAPVGSAWTATPIYFNSGRLRAIIDGTNNDIFIALAVGVNGYMGVWHNPSLNKLEFGWNVGSGFVSKLNSFVLPTGNVIIDIYLYTDGSNINAVSIKCWGQSLNEPTEMTYQYSFQNTDPVFTGKDLALSTTNGGTGKFIALQRLLNLPAFVSAYTPQSLTPAQQAQARANIGAINSPNLPPSSYISIFKNLKIGDINGQNGFTATGGTVNNWDGECLNVNVNPSAGLLQHCFQFANGNMKFVVKSGNLFQMLVGTGLSSFLSVYIQPGSSYTINIGNQSTLLTSAIVSISGDYIVEVSKNNGVLSAMVYSVGQRKAIWDVNYSFATNPGDNVYFCQTNASSFAIKDVQYLNTATDLLSKISFRGSWYPIVNNEVYYIKTISQGVSFLFKTNSTQAVLNGIINTSVTPIIAVSVDHAKPYLVNLTNSTTLFSGLDNTKEHTIEVWVDGLKESDNLWSGGQGVYIHDIAIDSGAYITNNINNSNIVKFKGDSITEGVNVRSTGALPTSNSGYNVYSSTTARLLNVIPIVRGFGATGLSVSGSGGVPKYLTSDQFYENNYPMFNEQIPDIIAINGGTNDNAQGVSSGQFTNDYQAYINYLQARYPLAKIILLVPINGSYRTEITNLGATNTLPVIDLSAFSGITTTDGIHPDLNGTITLANQLSKYLKSYLN